MKISVLINNYNYGRFLKQCLQSAVDQTRTADEIILYDDGSSDDSLAVLERWRPAVTAIANPNFGQHPSVNQANAIHQAFLRSSGEIICLLDSDDTFLPEKLDEVGRAFKERSDLVLVQHPFREIDAAGHATGIVRPRLKRVDPRSYIQRTHNLTGLFAQTSGLAFRRTYLEKVLPLARDTWTTVWPDVRLTRRSLFFGPVHTIHEPLGEYRVHGANDWDKLADAAYLANCLQEQYAYFNSVAAAHGAREIDLQHSLISPRGGINAPGLGFIARASLLLQSREPLGEKLRIVANWLARQSRKMTALGNPQ